MYQEYAHTNRVIFYAHLYQILRGFCSKAESSLPPANIDSILLKTDRKSCRSYKKSTLMKIIRISHLIILLKEVLRFDSYHSCTWEIVELMAIHTGPRKLVTRLTPITISGQPNNGTSTQG